MKRSPFSLFFILTVALISMLGFVNPAVAQEAKPEAYKILGISVEGNKTAEAGAIIGNSGLKVGDEITIPGSQSGQVLVRLWALKIFSDVQLLIENKVADGIYLLIRVKEHPRLERVEFAGNSEQSDDDLLKKINVVRGQLITPLEIEKTVKTVKKLYEEDGYLQATVKAELAEAQDANAAGKSVLKLNIDEGKQVRVQQISFEGNMAFDDSDLKGEMKETSEKKWWKFWKKARFDRKKYEEDKKSILHFYHKNGYRDAEVVSDSLSYDQNKEDLLVHIKVREGSQYRIRDITWEGNKVYPAEILSARLGFKKGDVFNAEKFEMNLRGNEDQTDVSSLYLDNGYLTSNLDPEYSLVVNDSLDVKIRVFERNQFKIGHVFIRGNTKTKEKVIRRELFTRPGDYFSRAVIIRSIRQLSVLNYFNPEKIKPDYSLNPDNQTVDLTYEVEEKSSDSFNASVGYSGTFGFTGALGLTFNNFSITDPLAGGGGQSLNLDWQFGESSRFRTFSIGFLEPWLLDTPTSFGVSLFDTRTILGFDERRTGGSFRLGRRFSWPDNYFRGDWTFSFQRYDVKNGQGLLQEGTYSQFNLQQTISRSSIDNPVFPTSGSSFSLSIELSGKPFLPGNTSYQKYSLSADWHTPLFGSSRLVLYSNTLIGVIGHRQGTIIPFTELFWMGGTGLASYYATTPLRGYEDRSVGPTNEQGQILGGRSIAKYSAELRYSLSVNPIPIYLLAFAESGNVWRSWKDTDPFDLRRSAGIGARLLINPIGLIGFDYAYGFDDVLPKDGKPDGWHFHFQFGRGF
ncbi:MAG: outer membrane protein assembly factor BamA [Bacteroidota bacterium]